MNDNGDRIIKRWTEQLVPWVFGTLVLGFFSWLSWLTVDAMNQRSLLATEAARIGAIENRLNSLETGRTTPMAAETRGEFNAVWREIERLRKPD